ncbi:MAG: class I SAM-dependent methyltransferase [Gammaproteobacteria bacterium]|nr:class I SAM-dependent methyltransferase [Gammaproteobacteria bacterium]
MTDSRSRFSDRVANYIRYRPGYPSALVSALVAASANPVVADVGSGTGIFTRLLLQRGLRVFGIEPNANMRQAGEEYLAEYSNFVSIDGGAEDTGLVDSSIDLITAAQAFHWFHNEQARIEFARILKPDGRLALIWNKRRMEQPFQQAYDALLREIAPEYGLVSHMNLSSDDIAEFFTTGEMEIQHFDNQQNLDFEALSGRLKSSSYCPAEGTQAYERLLTELRDLFDKHAIDGRLAFEYDTQLYRGPLAR